MDILPHVILTDNAEWGPGVLDQNLYDNETWFDAISDLSSDSPPAAFDEGGDYTKRIVVQSHDIDRILPNTLWYCNQSEVGETELTNLCAILLVDELVSVILWPSQD